MARRPRIHIPGGFYHIMLRGNGGQDIFYSAEDRHHFYLLLQQGVSRYSHRIHGFCCMTNHVHLLIQVAEEPLSKIMQNLSFRYTRWINKRKKRIGNLFQGRYKAILVDADQYLLELVRYIHLNPVRAGLVKQVEDYAWSSHVAYTEKEMLPWLTTDWVYGHFSRQRAACIRQYIKFVDEGMGEQYRKEFHAGQIDGRVLGEDEFMEKVLKQLDSKPMKPPSLRKIIVAVCSVCKVNEKELSKPGRQRILAEARGIIAWFAMQKKSATLTSLAQRFQRDLSAMSLAAKKIEEKRVKNKALRDKIREIDNSITQA